MLRARAGHVRRWRASPDEGADGAVMLRAAVVRQILLGAPGAPALHDKGLRLRGAWIDGALDLQG